MIIYLKEITKNIRHSDGNYDLHQFVKLSKQRKYKHRQTNGNKHEKLLNAWKKSNRIQNMRKKIRIYTVHRRQNKTLLGMSNATYLLQPEE